jgi:hypothetical protein
VALAYADQPSALREETHTLLRQAPAGAPPAGDGGVDGGQPHLGGVVDSGRLRLQCLAAWPMGCWTSCWGWCAVGGAGADYRFENPLLLDADFTDWRTVSLGQCHAENPAPAFYDLPTLREAAQVRLRIRRAGFFTTPAFLANFPTNEDNLFR